jgi:hypothetical protein
VTLLTAGYPDTRVVAAALRPVTALVIRKGTQMRYRIPAILVAAVALIALSAPAALAGANRLSASGAGCPVGSIAGPYHIKTNDNPSAGLGITYHGPVSQATITPSPGDSRLKVVACSGVDNVFVIYNASGNCLRMHDQSSGYGVFEEDGCQDGNFSEQWIANQNGTSWQFLNRADGKWLGVTCPASNGEGLIGVPTTPDHCLSWHLDPT